jgi:hypothetical protein
MDCAHLALHPSLTPGLCLNPYLVHVSISLGPLLQDFQHLQQHTVHTPWLRVVFVVAFMIMLLYDRASMHYATCSPEIACKQPCTNARLKAKCCRSGPTDLQGQQEDCDCTLFSTLTPHVLVTYLPF